MATSRSSSRDDKLLTKTEQQEQEQEQEQQEIISKDDDAHNSNDITLLQKQPITTDQLLTNVFDPSKIKNFLYKEEPNMARLNGPSLDLISTTAALLLKSIVEKAIRLDNDNDSSSSLQQQQQQQRNKKEGDKGPPEQILITSTHLKRLISSSNPSLEFLQETYENVIDKDGSARVSSLREYIPAVKKVKVKQGNKRGAAANSSSSIINQTDNSKDENNNNNNNSNNSKQRRKTDSGTCTSSAFIDSNTNNKDNSLFSSSDDAPLEKAIADATNTKESRMLDKIIADEDDYD